VGKARFIMLLAPLALAGCEVKLDPNRFDRIMQQYNSKPNNKALFVNLENMNVFLNWSNQSIDGARKRAHEDCAAAATAKRVDPGKCVLFYLNNQQIVNPEPCMLPRMTEADRRSQERMWESLNRSNIESLSRRR